MASDNKLPQKLYKYKRFDNTAIEMIVVDKVYFADPSEFNDPLDTRTSLDIDIDDDELERIVRKFIENRTRKLMGEAADTVGYRGPKTKAHIERYSRREADVAMEEIQNGAEASDRSTEDAKRDHLRYRIEVELIQQYEKGLVPLAERATCPLMWSHYGDQHRGICVGYSVPADTKAGLHKVNYGGNRKVKASAVAAMLNDSSDARSQVDQAVLLRKANSWRYEKEWRLVGIRGLRNSPLELEEVIFGLRCKAWARYTIVKVLEDRQKPVKFYEVREVEGSFNLRKYTLDYSDEMFSQYPRRALSKMELLEAFRSTRIS